MSAKIRRMAKCIILGSLLLLLLIGCASLAEKPGNKVIAQPHAAAKQALPLVPSQAKNARDFGALGDGVADDTAAIQAAIDAAAASTGDVVIPAGIYQINALQSLHLRDHIRLYMTEQTILQASPNDASFYVVLSIENVTDVQVFGGIIRGDRREHQGTKGQWGTGLQVSGAKDVLIQGTRVENCWGDGFYIGTEVFTGPQTWKALNPVPENIQLIDVQADHNRRQGISIIAGKNVELIRPVLTNTGGQDPEGGLDIEPNRVTDIIDHLVVSDAFTAGNKGAGIQIFLSRLAGTSTPVTIEIKNHQDEGSKRGLSIVGRDEIVAGQVLVDKAQWSNNLANGLKIENHDARSYFVGVQQCQVINANRRGSQGAKVDGAAIAIVHSHGNVVGRTGCIGNVILTAPVIDDQKDPLLTIAPFHIWDSQPGYEISNLWIRDPVICGRLKAVPFYKNVLPYLQYSK